MSNYQVILFKNKKAKKILNKFITLKKAKEFYHQELKKSNEVLFDLRFENGAECRYEIAIVENSSGQLVPVYLTDEMGRSVKVKLENSGMTIFEISNFKKEESIFDLTQKKKIYTHDFLKRYLKGEGVKVIYSINNKLVVQNDEKINLFSLKNESEVMRYLDFLTTHFLNIDKKDCLVVKDDSTAQRKYIIKLLTEFGIEKKTLYRKTTTHPRNQLFH